MGVSRATVYAVVGIIVGLTLASGPLVGAVDLTSERGPEITDQFGNGSADVTVEPLPESLTISQGRYGSQQFYLRVPDVRANVSNVVGQPFLRYDVSIDEMGYSASTTAFLSPSVEGVTVLSMDAPPFDEGDVQQDRYDATITILVHSDGTDRIVERTNVTVEVER